MRKTGKCIAGVLLAMGMILAGAVSGFAARIRTDLNVENVRWDGDSGSGIWTDNTSARYYQVKLYRNESSVMSTASVYDNSYDFAGHMTRRGNYYFMVRAVGSGSAKGEWVSSDTMFLTAEEADDLSYDYRHSYSGGPEMESMFPAAPEIPAGTRPAPAVPVVAAGQRTGFLHRSGQPLVHRPGRQMVPV